MGPLFPKFRMAPDCPSLFIHLAYNVSRTTGVVAPQSCKLTTVKLLLTRTSSLRPHIYVRPKISAKNAIVCYIVGGAITNAKVRGHAPALKRVRGLRLPSPLLLTSIIRTISGRSCSGIVRASKKRITNFICHPHVLTMTIGYLPLG